MEWRELTPNEFIALESQLDAEKLREQAGEFDKFAEDNSGHQKRTFQRLGEGCRGLAKLAERFEEMDGPPIAVFRLPEVEGNES